MHGDYGKNGQLGNGMQSNSNVPVKVEGITNIIKIDAYKNRSIALSNDGNVYAWGEGLSNLPIRMIFPERIVDISGELVLTETGKVYKLTDTTKTIEGLPNIAKISCGASYNLALSTDGILFKWSTGKTEGIEENIYEISAGNSTSILETEDRKIYELGTTLEEIKIEEEIEEIACGEGTHQAIVAKDGFVWNKGTNTSGELATGDTVNKSEYTKVGITFISSNFEKVYLEVGEQTTITAKLENSLNLKIDIVDENQDNFTLTPKKEGSLKIDGKTVTAIEYGSTIIEITHNSTGTTKEVTIVVVVKMESIVQGFKNIDLGDGEYTVVINGQEYLVELINYYDNVRYSLDADQTEKTISLGDNTEEYKTLVVKYHNNLVIDEGVTVTANTVNDLTYKKGMYLCVLRKHRK